MGPQGQQQTVMFGGQPVMAAGQQGGQMMMGQQGGQMMMGQPMMMGQQGGQMMMGQPMMMGQQGGQMMMGQPAMMGQPMMMGQQGGQMATGQPMVMGQPMVVGQPMVMMGGQQAVGPWPAQMQVGPMGQLPQVQMAGVPMGQMAYPQMYPPPSAGVMYNSAQGGMVVMVRHDCRGSCMLVLVELHPTEDGRTPAHLLLPGFVAYFYNQCISLHKIGVGKRIT